MAPAPEFLDLASLHERRDLARLRILAIDGDLEKLTEKRDELVRLVRKTERTIDEQEGRLTRPGANRQGLERAREHLRRDQ